MDFRFRWKSGLAADITSMTQPHVERIEIRQRSSLLPSLRRAILSVGGADRAHFDSGLSRPAAR
jgi:hypothetical protein